jgi:hypothetical protein
MGNLGRKKKKVDKKIFTWEKDGEMVIGYTFRVGYIYRADCISIYKYIYLYMLSFQMGNGSPGKFP